MENKEEKNYFLVKKIVYFLMSAGMTVGIYILLYILLALVNVFVVVHPYIKLGLLIVFLVLSAFLTSRIMNSKNMADIYPIKND